MRSCKSTIIIVTAPSGTGKTTLTRRLLKENKDLSFSISVTTRPIRKGEINGEHYWYVTTPQFMQLVKDQRMIEWANVFGNLYGTTKDEIKRIQDEGRRAVLEIDVQGANSIREQYSDACSIFIMPPSVESLWERLKQRGTDPIDVRWHRLQTAKQELFEGKNFQHFIINNELEIAYAELKNLVVHHTPVRLSHEEGLRHCNQLLHQFQHSIWNSDTIPDSIRD